MSDTDIKRLMDIAKKGLRKKRTKEEILNTFFLAGILNLDGTYTDNYPNLKAWEAERKTNK